jgi:hypothetical protein
VSPMTWVSVTAAGVKAVRLQSGPGAPRSTATTEIGPVRPPIQTIAIGPRSPITFAASAAPGGHPVGPPGIGTVAPVRPLCVLVSMVGTSTAHPGGWPLSPAVVSRKAVSAIRRPASLVNAGAIAGYLARLDGRGALTVPVTWPVVRSTDRMRVVEAMEAVNPSNAIGNRVSTAGPR